MSVRHRVQVQEANGSIGDLQTPLVNSTSSTKSNHILQSRETGEHDEARPKYALRVLIKWIALLMVALCTLTGTVVSKVSLVSITGRMYNLSELNLFNDSDCGEDSGNIKNNSTGSKLFIQLVLLLIVPELISFLRCLIWGVIGKTSTKFPWPDCKAIAWVRSYIV